MDSRVMGTRAHAKVLALAVALGVAGSLVMAPASLAAGAGPQPPAIGTACQPDGVFGISGSPFQANAMMAGLVYGYEEDVCGPVNTGISAADGTFGNPSVNVSGMVGYYIDGDQSVVSGEGGGGGSGDMAIPVAAAPVSMVVNLRGVCAVTPPSIDLTADELDKIWQGVINRWDDNELDATNPDLVTDGCAGPIIRVVNGMESGTVQQSGTGPGDATEILLDTLYGIDPNNLCDDLIDPVNGIVATSWYSLEQPLNWSDYFVGQAAGAPEWPTEADGVNSPVSSCMEGLSAYTWGSGTVNQSASDPNALAMPAVEASTPQTEITVVEDDAGSIGYTEPGLAGFLPPGVSFANLQTYADEQTRGNGLENATPTADANDDPAFVSGVSATETANCQLPRAIPTGSTPADAVGLGSPSWAASPTGTDAWANSGSGYPICTLTFDYVPTGSNDETGETAATPDEGAATAGCTIDIDTTTTADNASGVTTLTVPSTTGFPATGELKTGTQTLTYTAKTATTFTLSAATTADIPAGSVVALAGISTTAAATLAAPGVNGGCESVQGPLQGSTNDQLRTLYSFFSYVFSPLGQNGGYLAKQMFDPLPEGWLGALTQGFQDNF